MQQKGQPAHIIPIIIPAFNSTCVNKITQIILQSQFTSRLLRDNRSNKEMGKIVTKEYDDDEMFKSRGPVFAVYATAYI